MNMSENFTELPPQNNMGPGLLGVLPQDLYYTGWHPGADEPTFGEDPNYDPGKTRIINRIRYIPTVSSASVYPGNTCQPDNTSNNNFEKDDLPPIRKIRTSRIERTPEEDLIRAILNTESLTLPLEDLTPEKITARIAERAPEIILELYQAYRNQTTDLQPSLDILAKKKEDSEGPGKEEEIKLSEAYRKAAGIVLNARCSLFSNYYRMLAELAYTKADLSAILETPIESGNDRSTVRELLTMLRTEAFDFLFQDSNFNRIDISVDSLRRSSRIKEALGNISPPYEGLLGLKNLVNNILNVFTKDELVVLLENEELILELIGSSDWIEANTFILSIGIPRSQLSVEDFFEKILGREPFSRLSISTGKRPAHSLTRFDIQALETAQVIPTLPVLSRQLSEEEIRKAGFIKPRKAFELYTRALNSPYAKAYYFQDLFRAIKISISQGKNLAVRTENGQIFIPIALAYAIAMINAQR